LDGRLIIAAQEGDIFMSGSTYYSSLEDWAFRKRLMLAVVFTDVVRRILPQRTTQSTIGKILSGLDSSQPSEPNSFTALFSTQSPRPAGTNLFAQFLAGNGENDGENK
jgi:hypothetical protein